MQVVLSNPNDKTVEYVHVRKDTDKHALTHMLLPIYQACQQTGRISVHEFIILINEGIRVSKSIAKTHSLRTFLKTIKRECKKDSYRFAGQLFKTFIRCIRIGEIKCYELIEARESPPPTPPRTPERRPTIRQCPPSPPRKRRRISAQYDQDRLIPILDLS